MLLKISAIVVLSLVKFSTAEMEGFIVGGNFTKIQPFAHSAFILIGCVHRNDKETVYSCGGSIVNQLILLSAAHCFEDCDTEYKITAHVGHAVLNKGQAVSVKRFSMHPEYNPVTCANDIALLRLKSPLIFGRTVRRVVLMAKPPYFSPATVAGWGVVNEITGEPTNRLKYTSQRVFKRASCQTLKLNVPRSAFCAGVQNDDNYASEGDSGSALIVQDYIQIGLVSFKATHISRSVVIYTDVGYFYDWIQHRAKALFCQTPTNRQHLKKCQKNEKLSGKKSSIPTDKGFPVYI